MAGMRERVQLEAMQAAASLSSSVPPPPLEAIVKGQSARFVCRFSGRDEMISAWKQESITTNRKLSAGVRDSYEKQVAAVGNQLWAEMSRLAQEHRFSSSGFDQITAMNRTAGGAEKQGLKNFAQWVGCMPQHTYSD
eukprot:236220-Prymnesium_polylepis.1